MTKRFLALLLAVAMIVTVFAGCKKTGGDDDVSVVYETEYEYEYEDSSDVPNADGTTNDDKTPNKDGSSSKGDKTPNSSKDKNDSSKDKKPSSKGDKPADTATDDTPRIEANSNTNKTGFPIVKKKETITVMTALPNANSTDFEDMEFTKEYEKMTNMNIEWQLSLESDLKGKVTLALQSGNLPDIIFVDKLDHEDMLRYSAEGSFVQLTKDDLKEWAPNIYAAYNENPDAWKKTVAPDGKMWTIASFSKDYPYAQHYFWVRKTWLSKLGLQQPKTMDEFYKMLVAFKNNDPNGNGQQDEIPFAMWNHGGFLFNPWGFTGVIDVSISGKVTNMYTTANMKNSVEYWAKIYKEGLVDKGTIDNYTGGSMVPLKTLLKQGKVGCFWMGFPDNDLPILEEYVTLPYPTAGNNGDFPSIAINVTPVSDNGRVFITKKCKNTSAALRWLDYLYSDEGYMLRQFGAVGNYYKKTSNSTFELTGKEKVQQPSYTIRGKDYLSTYKITNESVSASAYRASQRTNIDNWCANTLKNNNQKFLPTTWKNQDEINAENLYSTYWNQVKGMWWQFVQGSKNMGADWTTLINEMNKKGINKYIAELQKYYDRCK